MAPHWVAVKSDDVLRALRAFNEWPADFTPAAPDLHVAHDSLALAVRRVLVAERTALAARLAPTHTDMMVAPEDVPDFDSAAFAQEKYREWVRHAEEADAAQVAVMSSLRPLREARGLSLREAARRAHVSPAALSNVENGTRLERFGMSAARRVLDVLTTTEPTQ